MPAELVSNSLGKASERPLTDPESVTPIVHSVFTVIQRSPGYIFDGKFVYGVPGFHSVLPYLQPNCNQEGKATRTEAEGGSNHTPACQPRLHLIELDCDWRYNSNAVQNGEGSHDQHEEATIRIIDIEGIGPAYAAKLSAAGTRTTQALLKKGASPDGRKEIASSAGIGHELILEWVNLADLYRVKGVGSEYSDRLEEAGVDTVVELSKRLPENLHSKMLEVNQAKNLVNKMPGLKQVDRWIREAKKMPGVVTY